MNIDDWDFLLIMKIRCMLVKNTNMGEGTLGLLVAAKQKKLITELKPLFEIFLKNKRYYSPNLLNEILIGQGEVSM